MGINNNDFKSNCGRPPHLKQAVRRLPSVIKNIKKKAFKTFKSKKKKSFITDGNRRTASESRGIRDPPRSQVIKELEMFYKRLK